MYIATTYAVSIGVMLLKCPNIVKMVTFVYRISQKVGIAEVFS